MRQRLADLARFAQAPAALGLGAAPSSPATATAAAPAGAQGGLLAQLLVGNPLARAAAVAVPAPATPATSIDALSRAIVAPHSVANIAPQQASLIACGCGPHRPDLGPAACTGLPATGIGLARRAVADQRGNRAVGRKSPEGHSENCMQINHLGGVT